MNSAAPAGAFEPNVTNLIGKKISLKAADCGLHQRGDFVRFRLNREAVGEALEEGLAPRFRHA